PRAPLLMSSRAQRGTYSPGNYPVPRRRSLVAALLGMTFVVPAFAQSPDWAAFDRYVAQAAKDWRVPALAIAVVKDDSLVFAKGYGTADTHTRFAIGSTTKAMTSAGLAMLADEGKLRW